MSGVTMAQTMRKLAAKGLLVVLGIQHDGGVYGLDFRSHDRIKQAFPEAAPLPMIMLGRDCAADFDRIHPPLWERMVLLLTGLTREQIAELGGVTIYDADNERIVWEWHPETVTK
jgi:hypothetical protein